MENSHNFLASFYWVICFCFKSLLSLRVFMLNIEKFRMLPFQVVFSTRSQFYFSFNFFVVIMIHEKFLASFKYIRFQILEIRMLSKHPKT